MTNKIYLSFNRLYRLQDGDYHGAKLSFKIKHGEKVIAEGEHVGKTLSKFISPITIEETEITQQLTVEYVCTGNVEDVSVSSANPALVGTLLYLDGHVFIREAFVQDAIITNAVANNIDALQHCQKELPDDFSEQLSSAISELVRSVIKQELKPGGLILRAQAR